MFTLSHLPQINSLFPYIPFMQLISKPLYKELCSTETRKSGLVYHDDNVEIATSHKLNLEEVKQISPSQAQSLKVKYLIKEMQSSF